MRSILSSALVLLATGTLVVGVRAGDAKKDNPKKEVTVKGTILCAKCALKETAKCTTAIQAKEGDKLVTYYLDDKGHSEKYHDAVCGGDRKPGVVTGTATEKDGKRWIRPTKVEYLKK